MNIILKNIELKILALFSAIILWFFVVGIENNSFRFPEQLEVHAIGVSEDLSVTNDLGKATIRIRAPQDLIKNLTKTDFDVTVDAKNLKAGEYNLPLVATSKNDKVTILKVEPATTHIVLEAVTQKDVKLKAVVSGSPAKGFRVNQIQFSPATVTLHGGKTLLDKITDLNVEIKLNGTESANFNTNVTLKLPENLSKLTLDQEQAAASVTVDTNIVQKTIPIAPHLDGSSTALGKSQIVLTPRSVIVQGNNEILDKIQALDTEVVSYESLKGTNIPTKLKIILPEGVTLLSGQPSVVTITLTNP